MASSLRLLRVDTALPLDEAATAFDDDDVACGLQEEMPEPAAESTTAQGSLSIATRSEYGAAQRGGIEFVAVKVKATVDSGETKKQRKMDLVLVLDVSGSMQGDKFDELKRAVQRVVSLASSDDRVCVVVFSHEAARLCRLLRMTAQGKAELLDKLARLGAYGGTDIVAGLTCGLDVMQQRRFRNEVASVVLLTDGQDDHARGRFAALVRRAEHVGSALYAFGLGADHDATLLQCLAECARTPFTYLENAEAQSSAFAGLVAGLASVTAQRVQLTLELHTDLLAVHTPFAQRREGCHLRIDIPDMFQGETRDVLLEVRVAQGPGERCELFTARLLYYDLPSAAWAVSEAPTVTATLLDEPQPEAEPDAEVADQRARVQVARALVEAVELADSGRSEAAMTVLQRADEEVSSRDTVLSRALTAEVRAAQARMQNPARWRSGGRAENLDAAQTFSVQRCTTVGAPSRETFCREAQRNVIAELE